MTRDTRLCHLSTDTWRKTCMLWYPHTNIPVYTPTPPHTHTQQTFYNNGLSERTMWGFYHSHSLKQQPSAKCARSTLVSVGVIVKCYTCAHTCIWMGPTNSSKGLGECSSRRMIAIHQHSLFHIPSWTLLKVHKDECCRYKTDDFIINSTSTTV